MFKKKKLEEENSPSEKKKKKRKNRMIILAVIFGAFLIFLVAAVEYTSHSQFCAACHYMKPYFQSWEESSHSEFECSVCHYPPGGGIKSKLRKKIEGLVMVGRYWTKLYVKSKPWAEIKDESCMRSGCHEKRLLEGEVRFKKVVFDHKVHFEDLKRGKKLQCTSCHSQIVQGEHITVTESSCFICHFKESEFYPQIRECSHCHKKKDLINEETSRYNHSLVFENGFSCEKCHSNIIIGDGEVPRENCYKCHMERERLSQYNDTDLMHNKHIYENKIECNQCHWEIQHKISKDIETIADCRTCHTDYHIAQKILYSGQGGKGISHPQPNIMLEKGLSCKGCHMFHEKSGGGLIESDTLISKEESCESCHGEGFARILKSWETSTSKKLSQIKNVHRQSQREISRSQHAKKEEAENLLNEAEFNIELVEKGKSVHNVTYSQELLFVSYQKIQEALERIESNYNPQLQLGIPDEVPTQCYNCHAGIEEINTSIFGLDFPHKNHLLDQKIECSACHSNVRKHGEFIATKQTCAGCHHLNAQINCQQCHTLQQSIYQGGLISGMEIPRDIMSEAEVECVDCHRNDQNKIYRSDKSKCADCHDEDYQNLFIEWQKTFNELIQAVLSEIKARKQEELSNPAKDKILKMEKILIHLNLDGSSGIHNFFFIEETLTGMQEKLKNLK